MENTKGEVINFELVSPEEKLVSEPVKLAVMPGDEGAFGVGRDHMSLVASLRPGIVELFTEEGGEKTPVRRIFIAGGFADVTADLCVVLAEEAIDVADLDQGEIEKQLEYLAEDLAAAEDPIAEARIERAILLTKARWEAVTGSLAA